LNYIPTHEITSPNHIPRTHRTPHNVLNTYVYLPSSPPLLTNNFIALCTLFFLVAVGYHFLYHLPPTDKRQEEEECEEECEEDEYDDKGRKYILSKKLRKEVDEVYEIRKDGVGAYEEEK
jgi:hypothetical protein